MTPECGPVTAAEALKGILDAFLLFGESLDLTFRKEMTEDDKKNLQPTITKGRKALLLVFYFEFYERPTVHLGVHLAREADLHGTPSQTEVSVKEMVHKRPKYTATHGNHHEISREMLLHENAEQALKFVLRGGVDGLVPGKSLTALLEDEQLIPLFSGWLVTAQDETQSWTAHKGKRKPFSSLPELGYPRTFREELVRAYQNEFAQNSRLVQEEIYEAESPITFAPLDGKEGTNLAVKDFMLLAVGGQEEIARISHIFIHKGKDDVERLFVAVRWFVPRGKDSKTGWVILKESKADANRAKYDQIFSFMSIKRKIAVEHLCTGECHVNQGQKKTAWVHSATESFLVNPWMS